MSERDVLLAIYKFSELKSFANNAKIKSSLKFILVRYEPLILTISQFIEPLILRRPLRPFGLLCAVTYLVDIFL